MDTITHGIAGALIAKAAFNGADLFPPEPVNKRRIITWSLTLGAIFPDSDVLRDFISRNPMLIVTWHRSITHSLVCLPIWAVLLAALTACYLPLAQVGLAFVPRALRPLGSGNSQPYFSRPGHQLRHHDLVPPINGHVRPGISSSFSISASRRFFLFRSCSPGRTKIPSIVAAAP